MTSLNCESFSLRDGSGTDSITFLSAACAKEVSWGAAEDGALAGATSSAGVSTGAAVGDALEVEASAGASAATGVGGVSSAVDIVGAVQRESFAISGNAHESLLFSRGLAHHWSSIAIPGCSARQTAHKTSFHSTCSATTMFSSL
jgi:hypothetical protein